MLILKQPQASTCPSERRVNMAGEPCTVSKPPTAVAGPFSPNPCAFAAFHAYLPKREAYWLPVPENQKRGYNIGVPPLPREPSTRLISAGLSVVVLRRPNENRRDGVMHSPLLFYLGQWSPRTSSAASNHGQLLLHAPIRCFSYTTSSPPTP